MKRLLIIQTLSLFFVAAACNKYVKKNEAVYYKSWNEGTGKKETKLSVDRTSFRQSRYKNYATDKAIVFYKGQPVAGADAASFEAIGEWFAKDNYRGYYGGDPIASSEGKCFRVVNSYYSTDGKDVFFKTQPLHVSDPGAFKFVYTRGEDAWERWATDGHYYYYSHYKVPSPDYVNMVLYKKSGGLSKDSRQVYFRDHLLTYDHKGERIIDTVDASSFEVTGYFECRDRLGCINVLKGRTGCEK